MRKSQLAGCSILACGAALPPLAGAQVPAADRSDRPQPTLDLSLSGAYQLPGAGSGGTGLGPVAGAQLRWPLGRGRLGLVAGLAYGVVFTDGFEAPDGTRYARRPEALLASIGPQWTLGARRRFALDLQWNPTLGRTAAPGPQPPWRRGERPWTADFSTVSVGARWALASRQGPEVALVGRLYSATNPYGALRGAFGVAPTFGIALRPR